MTLLELADAVEKAAGPDSDLDVAIAKALAGPSGNYFPRSYTASIDAARTLVPEGRSWSIEANVETFDANDNLISDSGSIARIYHEGSKRWADDPSYAATPALALTAASLRALAAQGDGR